MTPGDRKELERLLDIYGAHSFEHAWAQCDKSRREKAKAERDKAGQALIAFVDRLANSQLRQALDVAVKALETQRDNLKGTIPITHICKQLAEKTLDEIQAILKGEK